MRSTGQGMGIGGEGTVERSGRRRERQRHRKYCCQNVGHQPTPSPVAPECFGAQITRTGLYAVGTEVSLGP